MNDRMVGQLVQHARVLRALARKQERDAHVVRGSVAVVTTGGGSASVRPVCAAGPCRRGRTRLVTWFRGASRVAHRPAPVAGRDRPRASALDREAMAPAPG